MNGATNARHAARAVAESYAHPPQLRPPHAVHVTALPRVALHLASALEPSAQLLYLRLWFALAEIHGSTCPRWFWHTDAQLEAETNHSRRTLTRLRPVLEDAGLIFWTRNRGTIEPTWYLLRWPPPPPPNAQPEVLALWADEHRAAGAPPAPLDAWAALVPRSCTPEIADASREYHQRRNPSSARRLSPWARLQLAEWADVEHYRKLYPQTLSLPYDAP